MAHDPVSIPEVAFLSQGKVHLLAHGSVTPVESAFAEDVNRREREIQKRQEWKTEGSGARFLSGGMMMAAEQIAPATMPQVTSVAAGRESGQLLYSIHVGGLAGLFVYDVARKRESRIQHGREDRLLHLSRPGLNNRVACSVESDNGARHLAVLAGDSYELSEVTEGDSRDEAPSWVEGKNALVYHSAGLARSPEGHVVGMSPFSICRVDLDTGEVNELASDDAHDFLAPRQSADGTLYFIRRLRAKRANPLKGLLSLLALPFRFLYAIFQWLNFFTLRYTGKSLSSDGQEQQNPDPRQLLIWGNLIDAARSDRDSRNGGGEAPIVDSSWKLIKRTPDGRERVVASAVVSFDIRRDGAVVYTNGSAIYRISPHRPEKSDRKELLAEAPLIEQIVGL